MESLHNLLTFALNCFPASLLASQQVCLLPSNKICSFPQKNICNVWAFPKTPCLHLNPTLVNDFEVFVSQKVEKISDYIKSSYIEFASRKNECNLKPGQKKIIGPSMSKGSVCFFNIAQKSPPLKARWLNTSRLPVNQLMRHPEIRDDYPKVGEPELWQRPTWNLSNPHPKMITQR